MNIKYILYNPYAGSGRCKEDAEELAAVYDNTVIINMCRINSYKVFFEGLEADAGVIICGGDGTLNRFVNDTKDIDINNPIYYFASGTGNDFAHDIGHTFHDAPDYKINPYIKGLPTVTVNGKSSLFINGIGYGIDGYCCETGDKLREKNKLKSINKPVNYTAIAVKGLLFHFKPRNAIVTVDDTKYTYKKVWLAPAMHGRFYGGGMMPSPSQDRENADHKISLMVFHDCGRLKTLMIFPSIFSGKHVKHTKQVSILEGKDITVEFDRPTPLQIDGDTILNVKSYTVNS